MGAKRRDGDAELGLAVSLEPNDGVVVLPGNVGVFVFFRGKVPEVGGTLVIRGFKAGGVDERDREARAARVVEALD